MEAKILNTLEKKKEKNSHSSGALIPSPVSQSHSSFTADAFQL
jgi:hypothetical protein